MQPRAQYNRYITLAHKYFERLRGAGVAVSPLVMDPHIDPDDCGAGCIGFEAKYEREGV